MSGRNTVRAPCTEQEEVGNKAEFPTKTTSQKDVNIFQSSWKFCCTIQFCKILKEPLALRRFSAEILEKALLNPDAHHRLFLAELLYKV
jgi:hypothetical protein